MLRIATAAPSAIEQSALRKGRISPFVDSTSWSRDGRCTSDNVAREEICRLREAAIRDLGNVAIDVGGAGQSGRYPYCWAGDCSASLAAATRLFRGCFAPVPLDIFHRAQ